MDFPLSLEPKYAFLVSAEVSVCQVKSIFRPRREVEVQNHWSLPNQTPKESIRLIFRLNYYFSNVWKTPPPRATQDIIELCNVMCLVDERLRLLF